MNLNQGKVPLCIACIPDGNRRWAKEQGRSVLEGHKAGYSKFKEVIKWAKEAGVRTVIFWGFSTENWDRAEEEVAGLMSLFRFALSDSLEELKKEKMQIRFIGQRERFTEDIQNLMLKAEEETKDYTEGTIVLAVSYGGRAEILSAVNQLLKENEANPVTEERFEKYLWTKDIPEPDMIIRPGGEYRLSGFLPWQSVYSEFFFTETLWPALTKEEFMNMLAEFTGRDRRRGK